MAELPSNQFPERDEFADIIDKEATEFLGAVTDFDRYTKEFLDNVALLPATYHDPDGDINMLPDLELTCQSNAFGGVARAVLSGAEFSDKVAVLAQIAAAAGSERAEIFNSLSLCEDNCIEAMSQEEIEVLLVDAIESVEDIHTAQATMAEMYLESLMEDTGILMEHLEYDASVRAGLKEEDETKTNLEIHKSVKEHAIDIAKIAGGMLAAMAISHVLRRGKQ